MDTPLVLVTISTVSPIIQHAFFSIITITAINIVIAVIVIDIQIHVVIRIYIIVNRIMIVFKQFYINVHSPPKFALILPLVWLQHLVAGTAFLL